MTTSIFSQVRQMINVVSMEEKHPLLHKIGWWIYMIPLLLLFFLRLIFSKRFREEILTDD